MHRSTILAAVAVAVPFFLLAGSGAEAKCTRLAFSVNDYGKDGPTKDAKDLLDKHIAEQMTAKGIAKYTVGKKDVSCELFLDFIVFDEHTCRAEATVCWSDGATPAGKAISQKGAGKAESVVSVGAAEAESAAPAKTSAAANSTIELAPGLDESAPAASTGATPVVPATSAETPVPDGAATAAVAPAAAPATSSPVEEPGIPEPPDAPAAEPVVQPIQSAGRGATDDGAAPSTETGSIEKFAAPRNIVAPAPIEATRAPSR